MARLRRGPKTKPITPDPLVQRSILSRGQLVISGGGEGTWLEKIEPGHVLTAFDLQTR